jgi:hypothetical protein
VEENLMTHEAKPVKTGSPARPNRSGRDTTAIPKSPQPFAAAEGTSIFQTAATKATARDLEKVREMIGPIDLRFLVELYRKSHNPVWLWVAIAMTRRPQDIPPEAFDYLHHAGNQLWNAVTAQAYSLETVRILSDVEIDEPISRTKVSGPPLPNILQLLELSHPGRNLIQAAAVDIRDLSIAIGVENINKVYRNREKSRAALAEALGRNSAETGPAAASIKFMEARGQKLASLHRRKKPKFVAS